MSKNPLQDASEREIFAHFGHQAAEEAYREQEKLDEIRLTCPRCQGAGCIRCYEAIYKYLQEQDNPTD